METPNGHSWDDWYRNVVGQLRDEVHKRFDNLWRKAAGDDYVKSFDANMPRTNQKGSSRLRQEAHKRVNAHRRAHYVWLAEQLQLPEHLCHFECFDFDMIRRAAQVIGSLNGQPIPTPASSSRSSSLPTSPPPPPSTHSISPTSPPTPSSHPDPEPGTAPSAPAPPIVVFGRGLSGRDRPSRPIDQPPALREPFRTAGSPPEQPGPS